MIFSMNSPNLATRRMFRLLRSGSIASPDYRAYRTALRLRPAYYPLGVLNITIDFELAWSRARRGRNSTTNQESLMRSQQARQALPELLRLATDYQIPLTFAIVAHAAIASCVAHQNPPPFRPSWFSEDWYACDPHTGQRENLDYYGADLVELIKKGTVHEIASHGFSHVDLADSETTQNVAAFEITESYRILRPIAPALTTFVFPKNHPAHLDMVQESGYSMYRGTRQGPLEQDPGGLWQFPLGLWLSPYAAGPGELRKLLDLGIQQRCLVNFWCHLYEFERPELVRPFFEPLFDAAAKRILRKQLAVDTMQGILKEFHHG